MESLDRRLFLQAGIAFGVSGLSASGLAASGLGASRLGGVFDLLPLAVASAQARTIGDGVLTSVSDGNLVLPMSFAYGDAPQDELLALLRHYGLSTQSLQPDCNIPVLRTTDRLIMFDVGAGPNFMPSAGQLLNNLTTYGIDPADVTDVVFTHCHPDHLWGLVDDFDEIVFANANFYMGRAEWDFWNDPATVDRMSDARKPFAVGAKNRLAYLEDRINLIEAGAEVLPGVEALDTSGHTPGHMSYMVHGGADPVLIAGDAITHFAVSFAHPEWPSGSDQDPEKGVATRSKLLDRLASERAVLSAYHLPRPGEGRVERDGAAYRFVASA